MVTRNLNHVVDKTSYPIPSAERSNERHRPLGIGVQGLADVFKKWDPYDSPEALEINNKIFETIYYGAVKMSIQSVFMDHCEIRGIPTVSGQAEFRPLGAHAV